MTKLQKKVELENNEITKFSIRKFIRDNLSIQRISYMAIFTAASVVLVLIVSTFLPVIIIQSFRVAFAGIFVKVAGLILGPIIGAMSGLLTDLFLLILRPSDYHPGYTLILVIFGFISGLAFFIREKSKGRNSTNYIFYSLVALIFTLGIGESFIIDAYAPPSILLFNLSWLSLSSLQTIAILGGGLAICLTMAFFSRISYKGDKIKMNDILIIILLNIFIDFIISQPLISFFDRYSSLGAAPFLTLFISRLGTSSVTVVWNTILIFIMWKILFPIVNRRLYK